MTAPAWLRRPATWAAVAGAGLAVALSLPIDAPAWIFWTAMGISCAGAAAWAFTGTGEARGD